MWSVLLFNVEDGLGKSRRCWSQDNQQRPWKDLDAKAVDTVDLGAWQL